jgi:hypothetical protein
MLASLAPEFEETKREILMRPDLPPISTIRAIIKSEETRNKVVGKNPKATNSHLSESYANFSSS